MEELINIRKYPKDILEILLQDKSTNENIIFATDTYCEYGSCYSSESQITIDVLNGFLIGLKPRIYRDKDEQIERTRSKAEVYTSAWLCNKMINYLDNDWFQSENIFNVELEQSWEYTTEPIQFDGKKWTDYIDSRRMEVACGEAPYLVSRYDATTGVLIDINNRIGLLDRKLRIVNENTTNEKDWFKWTLRAYQSSYGYEFQGDSLLIARINLLQTFIDYLDFKWHRKPTDKELKTIANVISWNVWQMDGLIDCIPFGNSNSYDGIQLSIFDTIEKPQKDTSCYIKDWRKNKKILFKTLKERSDIMKFDFIIGNPPYQDTTLGENENFAPPVYNKFMDASYEISDKVELITPARFLFNAGSTPKAWNEKMLNDKHFKVLTYEQDSSKFFSNTDIKGGVVITYRDNTKDFDPINIFIPIAEMSCIFHKVVSSQGFIGLDTISVSGYAYHFTEILYKEHAELIGKQSVGHAFDLKSNVFDKLTTVFYNELPNNEENFALILGRENNSRKYKYIKRCYINDVVNFDYYKIFLPKAIGIGAFGETIPEPILAYPNTGHTETFFSIGCFKLEEEAYALKKYLTTKFLRALLSILKKTQNITPSNFAYVPLQDFTENSDIDWNTSVENIDKQLYKKYNLSQEEIDFIEKNVKPME